MPEGCTLLCRARRDPAYGCDLELFGSFVADPAGTLARGPGDATLADFVRDAVQVVAEHPGIERRAFTLGRRWDMLYYLLADRRRNDEDRQPHAWPEQALFGGDVLMEGTETTIGSPIRYLAPANVRRVSAALSAVDPETFQRLWNVPAMIEASVYKIHPEDDERSLEFVLADFARLVAFYKTAAAHGEGVLACMS